MKSIHPARKEYVLSIPALIRPCATAFVFAMVSCIWSTISMAQSIQPPPSRPDDLPRTAHWMRALSNDGCNTFRDGRTLWLLPTDAGLKRKTCRIPRLCASLTTIGWSDSSELTIKLTPEPEHWDFSWKQTAPEDARIQVVFDTEPLLPAQLQPVVAKADGSMMLPANQAITVGQKLRFEPQWFKNTIGYWTNPDDYATWDVKINDAGDYSVAILQGCGLGQAGSEALLSLRNKEDIVMAKLAFKTVDTGHFQNFRWNHLGQISVKQAGTFQLRIEPTEITKAALCDIRSVHLVKQAK